MYVDKRLSARVIGKQLGMDERTVRRYLRDMGVEMRPPGFQRKHER